jgi:hypothetical protein
MASFQPNKATIKGVEDTEGEVRCRGGGRRLEEEVSKEENGGGRRAFWAFMCYDSNICKYLYDYVIWTMCV